MTRFTAQQEAFYQEVLLAFQKASLRHPDLTVAELLDIVARMGGYCIALTKPDERLDTCKRLVHEVQSSAGVLDDDRVIPFRR